MYKLISLLTALLISQSLFAQSTVRIATGLSRPLFVTYAPGDFERIFIVEQWTARARIFNLTTNTLEATPFLNIDSLVIGSGNERGFLGLAFHPDYQTNRKFYVSYNDNAGTSVIAQFLGSIDPDSAIASSRMNILTQTQPFSNHNGGCINFGPDGYLYIGFGDGGDANDPQGNAQNTNSLLGKMLRIDVNSMTPPNNYAIPADNPFVGEPGYRAEIWSMGLRNPWRWSFDRVTGDMYIADVGQNQWEEVNVEPAGLGGRNYGWRCMEGFSCTGLSGCTCNSPSLTLPVTSFSHSFGCSITGGYVYRGCAIPSLYGKYFYSDYCSATMWSFTWDGANGTTDSTIWTTQFVPDIGSIANVSSFGEDAYGELYICDLNGGEVFKVVPDDFTDCNSNTIADACDIANGTSLDIDSDEIPDECDDCFSVAAGDLTITMANDTVYFSCTDIGGPSATYTLWESQDIDAPFPAGWSITAQNLVASGTRLYYNTPAAALPEMNFYLLTTVCP
jgi:glucose/arabinose dehydrogenase